MVRYSDDIHSISQDAVPELHSVLRTQHSDLQPRTGAYDTVVVYCTPSGMYGSRSACGFTQRTARGYRDGSTGEYTHSFRSQKGAGEIVDDCGRRRLPPSSRIAAAAVVASQLTCDQARYGGQLQ